MKENGLARIRAAGFFLFVIVMGQLGIFISLGWGLLAHTKPISELLLDQGQNGNFLLYDIGLLISCSGLYFEDEAGGRTRELNTIRTTFLIIALILFLVCTILFVFLGQESQPHTWSVGFCVINTLLYLSSIATSFKICALFAAAELTAAEDGAKTIERTRTQATQITSTEGAIIAGRKINLKGKSQDE